MKLIIAYNKHRHGGGSDVVARRTSELLSAIPGVEVVEFVRDSRHLTGLGGKVRALVSGCYSREAVRAFAELLDTEKPELVHAQEIYPLISPWIFPECSKRRIPVVMTLHDYRMSCPIVTHFRDGALCHECAEHNELRCVQHNCCDSMAKSIAYAARNHVGRKNRLFLDYVDLFLTPSEKAREILCRYSGIPPEKVVAVGNPVAAADRQQVGKVEGWKSGKVGEVEGSNGERVEGIGSANGSSHRDYVAYAGRFEPEKGFDLLVEALAGTGLKLKVAGDASAYLAKGKTMPDHVEFAGYLDRNGMNRFYGQARLFVVPSLWHETFGLVVAEALSCATPVIVSDLGALAEVAGPGGLAVPAGDVQALRSAIVRLWNDEPLRRSMAEAGREHVKRYSEEAYVSHLLDAYGRALGIRH